MLKSVSAGDSTTSAMHDSQTTEQRPENWPLDGGEAPDTDSVRSGLGREQISKGSSSSSKDRRANETSQESQDHETGKIGDIGGNGLQDDEDEESDDVGRVASDGRDLGERREEERSDAICAQDTGVLE